MWARVTTMELLKAVIMVITAFISLDTFDSVGSYSALLRKVDLSVDKARPVLNMPTMDIDSRDITPQATILTWKM